MTCLAGAQKVYNLPVSRSGAVFATAFAVGFLRWRTAAASWAQGTATISPAAGERVDRLAHRPTPRRAHARTRDRHRRGRPPGLRAGLWLRRRLAARGDDARYGVLRRRPDASSLRLRRFCCSSQDGKLKLDDPVSKYVPEFKLARTSRSRSCSRRPRASRTTRSGLRTT